MKKFNLKNIKIDKTKTLILVGIITLLLFVGGATYAYFAFSSAGSISGNMNIISNTVDNLIFNVEKDIYINANLENFGQGMSDLSDDTDATATLIPNNSTNQATAMYNIYLIIEANDLEYTTAEHTPELLLNVTDPNGTKLENITGLVHHENGFDITTRTGGFLIASDYVINASNIAEVQTWNVEITLANLDSNQNDNMNKTFSAKLYLTQEKMSSYNPVQITNVNATPTYNSIDTTLNLSNGTADAEKYYFGIKEASSEEEVNYNEEDTPNYKFTGLLENTEYTIYSYVVDVNRVKSNVYETNITTSEYDLATIDSVEHSVTLNSITLTVNASSGDGTISKYMYSKDNGNSWEESNSNTHTFNNLNDTTEYKIKIKVVDSNNRESTEYYEAISTETYILPVVANVEYTTTYNSITLTPSGTDGTNIIDHCEYSINNGAYQTSNVFNNLTEQTQYTINVKAIDSNGRESNPYTIQVTTDTYKVPVISNVTTSSTTNSITINVEASNGDGTISKYMYSRDNGSNWYESTSNSYTFDNLTSNTTFYVQVKVVDNNGRESAVSNATVTTQYINPVVNSVSASNITSNSVTLTVSATAGSNSIATYYYSSNNGSSYVSSSSNTYTFSGLSAGTTYNFKVYVVDSGSVKSNEATTNATTENNYLADYIKNQLYQSDGVNNLYYHDGNGTYGSLEAGDNSYRYSGPNPKNYISFNNDLYRIIGLFDDDKDGIYNLKIIKNDYTDINETGNSGNFQYPYSEVEVNGETRLYKGHMSPDEITTYFWGNNRNNFNWASSNLNLINLNTTFVNYLGTTWSNKIEYHDWIISGLDFMLVSGGGNTKIVFDNEIGQSSTKQLYNSQIGLMYLSDYGYATSPTYWNNRLSDYNSDIMQNYNWMWLGLYEWTISLNNNDDYGIGGTRITDDGYVNMTAVWGNGTAAIRPCFYLNSDVTFVSGTGTSSDPYRIA